MAHTQQKVEIEPVGDRILVKPEPEEETMKGGIVIPSTAQEKPQIGVILEMGPTVNQTALATVAPGRTGQLEKGQRVLYGKYAGTEITVENEDFLILRGEDVLAILHSTGAT